MITSTFCGCSALEAVELGRFVLLDEVPGNGETWFLGRCFRELRRVGLAGVVSFSDPGRRLNGRGEVVFGGHVGTIYQAHNAAYLGRGASRNHYLLPTGRFMSPRALVKIRKGEQGWRYAVQQLVDQGAPPLAANNPSAPGVSALSASWVPQVRLELHASAEVRVAPVSEAGRLAERSACTL